MSEKLEFNWKYLIPGYGIYLITKSGKVGKDKFIGLNIFITIVLLAIIGSSGEESKAVNPSTDNKEVVEQKAVEENKAFKIGDSIKTEKFDLKVSSVTTRASVGGNFMNEKASDGAVFMIVNFSYKNITKKPINSFSVPDVKIFDPNGTEYDEAAGATIYYHAEINLNKKAISDINPGITQKDATVFEISKELWKSKGWKLVVDADEDIEFQIK